MHNFSANDVISTVKNKVAYLGAEMGISLLKTELKAQPSFYQGWLLLSRYLFEAGQYEDAIQASNNAEKQDILSQEFRQVQTAMQSKDYAEAEKVAQNMLAKVEGHPRAFFTLAHIGMLKQQPFDSVNALHKSLKYNPANLTLRRLLIDALVSAGEFQSAINAAKALVTIQASFASYWQLIQLLLKYAQYDEVLVNCDLALQNCEETKHNAKDHAKKLSQIHCMRAKALRIKGQKNKSIAAFHLSIQHNAINAEAWWGLADLKTYEFSQKEQQAIERCLKSPLIAQDEKAMAAFALAKANESNKTSEQAFDLYIKANQLCHRPYFSSEQIHREFDARIQMYSKDALQIQADAVNNEATPIFIVGLPRSGTTLVEQILASHSLIQSTIEQPTLPIIEQSAQLLCKKSYGQPLQSSLHQLSSQELSQLGNAYLQKSALFRQTHAQYFTDKLPFNFRLIGLIHKVLPHAFVVDVRRHPLDCGVSLFKQYFTSGVDFSYNLEQIGEFYVDYLRLMEHWDKALPGKVIKIQYEKLINEPEAQIRHLFECINVAFEEKTLVFHQSTKTVHSASSEQVRQPINTKGKGIWRSVENHISPLKRALGDEVLAQFK